MGSEIVVAIITGICTFLGVVVTVWFGNNKTLYRIDQLEKKVDKHNTVIERTYILEEKIKVANHRLDDLEKEKKND